MANKLVLKYAKESNSGKKYNGELIILQSNKGFEVKSFHGCLDLREIIEILRINNVIAPQKGQEVYCTYSAGKFGTQHSIKVEECATGLNRSVTYRYTKHIYAGYFIPTKAAIAICSWEDVVGRSIFKYNCISMWENGLPEIE